MGRLFTGTSGWVYKGWAGAFYPQGLASGKHLEFYSRHFNTVEINATFYRLPTENAVRSWRDTAPNKFIYAVKGSRFITQMKKLNVEPKSIAIFFERIAPLKQHLGPILWQLPPMLRKDGGRLERFLRQLSRRHRYAVEFRHPSWLDDEIFAILQKYRAAYVAVSSLVMPVDQRVTTDFIYLRFHGLEGGAAHDYTAAELKPWADHVRKCLRHGLDVYAYFNNDLNSRAPENARQFIRMVRGRKVSSQAQLTRQNQKVA
jgi:uncharacterized protein YecE (DUF72 family)